MTGRNALCSSSWDQQPTHVEKDQRAMIRRTIREIKSFTGRAPIGWLSPGLTETIYTPDYLAEAGHQVHRRLAGG